LTYKTLLKVVQLSKFLRIKQMDAPKKLVKFDAV